MPPGGIRGFIYYFVAETDATRNKLKIRLLTQSPLSDGIHSANSRNIQKEMGKSRTSVITAVTELPYKKSLGIQLLRDDWS